MRFSKYLQEEYITSYEDSSYNIVVFKNPSSSEIKDIMRSSKNQYTRDFVRFIADAERKDMWVFSPDTFHKTASRKIKKETGIDLDETSSFYGIGRIKNNKIELSERDAHDYYGSNLMYGRLFNSLKKKSWEWSDKYFIGKKLSEWIKENSNRLYEQKMPKDTPLKYVIKTLREFGFNIVRETSHIIMKNNKGLTISIPNHKHLNSDTLRKIVKEANLERNAFLSRLFKNL